MSIKRRDFLKKISIFSFFGLMTNYLLSSCSPAKTVDSLVPTTGGNCLSNGATTSVGTNHGHSATSIPSADINTAIQQTYTIGAGSAGHTHSVTVAASNFTDLKANTSVNITTTADGTGHTHLITINCA
ncbi:MAG: hypothetical protein AABY53_02790 [Bdellovibrionota bacterium]